MTWPEALVTSVQYLCSTFIIWRFGAGISKHLGDFS